MDRSWGRRLLPWVLLALILGDAVNLRRLDLRPPSLWSDDVWVAVLARSDSTPERLAFTATSPPLFSLLVAAVARRVDDPELGAQLVPFAFSLLLVLGVAVAGRAVGRRWAVALLAAVLVATHPDAIVYACRVKQFSSDALVAAGHLAFLAVARRRPASRFVAAWAAWSVLGLVLSTVSVFVLAAVGAGAAVAWARRRPPGAALAATALVVGGTGAAVWFLFVRRSFNPELVAYWKGAYLPRTSAGAFVAGALRVAWEMLARLTNGAPALGLVLACAGAFRLRRRPELLVAAGVLGVALLLANALERYPLEAGRTQLFTLPFQATFVATGATALASLARAPWRRRAVLAGIAALLLALAPWRARATYVSEGIKNVTARVVRDKTDADALLVHVYSGSGVAYYQRRWSVAFVPEPTLSCGFRVDVATPGFVSLGKALEAIPAAVDAASATRPARIFAVVSLVSVDYARALERALAARGYRIASVQGGGDSLASLIVFERG